MTFNTDCLKSQKQSVKLKLCAATIDKCYWENYNLIYCLKYVKNKIPKSKDFSFIKPDVIVLYLVKVWYLF